MNFSIYVLNYLDNRFVKALLKYITFVINNLKVKILIDINVLIFKNINLIISSRISYINNYNITFKLIITPLIKLFIK